MSLYFRKGEEGMKERRNERAVFLFTSNMKKSLLFKIYNNIYVAKHNLTDLVHKKIVGNSHDTSKQWGIWLKFEKDTPEWKWLNILN